MLGSIVRVYYPSPPSQLKLFVRNNKLEQLSLNAYDVRLIKSRGMLETNPKVMSIVPVQ